VNETMIIVLINKSNDCDAIISFLSSLAIINKETLFI
jgi:hypothetical protein